MVCASLGWFSRALDKHWKAILNVNLHGLCKSGVIFKSVRQALESHFVLIVNFHGLCKSAVIFKSIRQALEIHFGCNFTWCAQVWGDCLGFSLSGCRTFRYLVWRTVQTTGADIVYCVFTCFEYGGGYRWFSSDLQGPELHVNLRENLASHLEVCQNWSAEAILIVNLHMVRKSGAIVTSIRQALTSHFGFKFTWGAQVWGDLQEH